MEGISKDSDFPDWMKAKAGDSQGSHKSDSVSVSEDVSRIKSGDIQDWQCYPSAGQVENDASPTPMSYTPNVDGHQNETGYEQRKVTVQPNTTDIPYGPKPGPIAK